jgi:outer membrane receptor protein involved in Fe transport
MMRSLLLLVTLFSLTAYSQGGRPGGRPGGPKGGKPQIKGEIFGNVIDSISNESMAYVTVLAYKQPENKMVGGMVTSDNGNFSIPELGEGNYSLKITFVGYNTKFINNIIIDKDNLTSNSKDIQLGPQVLDVVEVVGEKPLITYEIDKKVINVEDQITNTSQTAVEVLENSPSITVDADGNVSLRGSSSFTLLIDGIPSAMEPSDALATIPASTIKEIEIITNPSAKFDAEGTSGVINIITKKNKLEGISLLANLSAGTFNNYSGDIAINIKKNNFTFNVGANLRYNNRPRSTYSERLTIMDSIENLLISEGESSWKHNSKGVSGEIQWTPNNSHVFIIKSNINGRAMNPYTDLNYESYTNNVLNSTFVTRSNRDIDMFGSSSSLFYQYNIKRNKAHNITFKTIVNRRDVTQNDTSFTYDSEGNITQSNWYTETGPSNFVRFNLDYKLPLKGDKKFEVGAQSQLGMSGDVGRNYEYNTTTNVYDFNELFSSDVEYTRDVHAGYSMFSGKIKDFGYQVGLRAEYTYRTIKATNFEDFANINRLDFFPSTHLSYSFKNKNQMLLSYSRRIQRPRSYYFEPFITWEDAFNVSSGNPNLVPEYINAFELSFIKPIKRKGFFSIETYLRRVENIIRRLSTVYTDGILISQPYNIGTSTSIGIEPSFNYSITKWWKINTAANVFLFNLDGEINDVDYSTESVNWNARISNTFKFKGFTFQFMSNYTSGTVNSQGESKGFFRQDASIRKGFAKNKYSFTLQGRNILATQKRIETRVTENVQIYSIRQPLAPQITLTFSLKLNNYQKVFDRDGADDDF